MSIQTERIPFLSYDSFSDESPRSKASMSTCSSETSKSFSLVSFVKSKLSRSNKNDKHKPLLDEAVHEIFHSNKLDIGSPRARLDRLLKWPPILESSKIKYPNVHELINKCSAIVARKISELDTQVPKNYRKQDRILALERLRV